MELRNGSGRRTFGGRPRCSRYRGLCGFFSARAGIRSGSQIAESGLMSRGSTGNNAMWPELRRDSDVVVAKAIRRYPITLSPGTAPTFQCGAAAFWLDQLVAIVRGESVGIRTQEARLLAILLRGAGSVVAYEAITSSLYGERIDIAACRARLKSLVADVRRRFGDDVKAALRTAPGRGLLLHLGLLEGLEPCCRSHVTCEPAEAPFVACVSRRLQR